MGAVAAGAATAGYYARDDKEPMPRGQLRKLTATHAGGVGMVAVPVLVTMAGPLALPTLLLVVATSPWAFRWLKRQSLRGDLTAMDTSIQQDGQHDEVWETTSLAVVESPAPTFAQPPAIQDLSAKSSAGCGVSPSAPCKGHTRPPRVSESSRCDRHTSTRSNAAIQRR